MACQEAAKKLSLIVLSMSMKSEVVLGARKGIIYRDNGEKWNLLYHNCEYILGPLLG